MAALAAMAACSQEPAADAPTPDHLLIGPLFADSFSCAQHWQGQLPHMGDALGSDCYVYRLVDTPSGGKFARAYVNDGLSNEDWFSWNEPVLAGIDGEIIRMHENPVVNEPGNLGEPPASMIVIKRADGAHLLYAHIASPLVEVGDVVTAGQQIAVVGNNGYGRNPHIHLGAWMDGKPLPIAFDLDAYGRLMDDADGSD